jgi:hypothetical protein
MKKKIYLSIILSMVFLGCIAQDTIPVWNYKFIMTNNKNGTIAGYKILGLDKNNNSYVFIDFNDSLLIGDSLFINNVKLSFILAKFDNNGKLCWMYKLVNKGNINSRDMVVDWNGDCYISGIYKGEFQISDNIKLDSTALFGRTFLAKINTNGYLVWAKGFSHSYQLLLTLNKNGNLFAKCSGAQGSTYQIGDSIFSTLKNEAVAKFDTSGKFYWAKTFAPINGVVADSSDNLFLFAHFKNKVVLDTFVLNPSGTGRYDIYIAKINNKAEIIWVNHLKNVNITLSTFKYNLTTDNSGNAYYGNVFRDSILISGKKYFSPQYDKLFFIKFNPDGIINWVKVSGGNNSLHEGISAIYYTKDNSIVGKIKVNTATEFNGHTIPNIDSRGSAYIEMDTSGYVTHLRPLCLPFGTLRKGINQTYFQLSGLPTGDSIKILGKFYKNSKSSDMFLVKYDTSSFNSIQSEFHREVSVKIYPNPAGAFCHVFAGQYNKMESVQLYNSLGMLSQMQNNIHSNHIQLDLSALPKGIYYVKIWLENNQFATSKLILE